MAEQTLQEAIADWFGNGDSMLTLDEEADNFMREEEEPKRWTRGEVRAEMSKYFSPADYEDEGDGVPPENPQAKIDQLVANFNYLLGVINVVHGRFFPGQTGTWNGLAEQVRTLTPPVPDPPLPAGQVRVRVEVGGKPGVDLLLRRDGCEVDVKMDYVLVPWRKEVRKEPTGFITLNVVGKLMDDPRWTDVDSTTEPGATASDGGM